MQQVSSRSDKQLNALSREISVAEKKIDEATAEKDVAWDKVIDIFAEHDIKRYVASDGRTLFLQPRSATPKLAPERLYTALFSKYGERKANRLWKKITEPCVNSVLLEQAVISKEIDKALVESCIDQGEGGFSRMHKEWTKADNERAFILGIVKEE